MFLLSLTLQDQDSCRNVAVKIPQVDIWYNVQGWVILSVQECGIDVHRITTSKRNKIGAEKGISHVEKKKWRVIHRDDGDLDCAVQNVGCSIAVFNLKLDQPGEEKVNLLCGVASGPDPCNHVIMLDCIILYNCLYPKESYPPLISHCAMKLPDVSQTLARYRHAFNYESFEFAYVNQPKKITRNQ